MTTSHTRRTVLAVRSEDCFEEMDLGTARRFIAECDAAGLPDEASVSLSVHGDAMRQLVAEAVEYEDLNAPAAEAGATPNDLHGGWVSPITGLVSGGYPPVLEANDREAVR